MASDATRYRDTIEQHGLSPTHHQIIAWVSKGARVLELGCSTGYIGRILIEEKGCTVTGVEIDRAAAAAARENGLTVLEGSLEDPAFRASIDGRYDVVIAADVIEHLADPAPILDHFKRWLAPGGFVIVAVPNIATWTMRAQLFFRGDFEYQETGILDRTHLHFFTWHTLHALVRAQGWTVDATMVDGWEIPGAHSLLFEIPNRIMLRTRFFADVEGALAQAAQKYVYLTAETVYKVGRSLGRELIRKWPNIAAPHVALVLLPPTSP
jgi:methionine biosynthesis protein MetW